MSERVAQLGLCIGITRADQRKLIKAWIDRHTDR